MEGVESVTQLDDERVHWVAEVAGKRKEWDAEITRQIPDREIDWVGLGDADDRGRIVFEAIDRDRSQVTMLLDYDPQTRRYERAMEVRSAEFQRHGSDSW
jgi:uncharacterized membrane protein